MKIVLAHVGSYPRIGEGPGQQRLRQATDRWEKGEIGPRELKAVQDDVTREVLEEQAKAGLDLATDGQVRWYDPVSHLLRATQGVEIGGLLRFFDTNNYFRHPVITGRIRSDGPVLASEHRYAKKVSPIRVKPVLTGPYTLSALSLWKGSPYKNFTEVVRALTKVVAGEVEALSKAGAPVIQVDEPSILKAPGHITILREALTLIAKKKGRALLCLQTYFADASPLYEKLQELPVDMLGLDLMYGPSLLDRIRTEGSHKILCLGLVDGRNTRLESPDEIAGTVEGLIPRLVAPEVHLSPSCGLEYLPRNRAFEKLKILKAVKERLERS